MDSNDKVRKTSGAKNLQFKPVQDKFLRPFAVNLTFDTSKGDDMLIRAKMRLDQKRKEATIIKDSPPYFK